MDAGNRRPTTRRNSLRYRGYDYRQPGWVFVTICTHRRQPLFGEVVDSDMRLSPPGMAVERMCWQIPEHVPGVIVDAVIVMPDHIHAIVMTGADPEIEQAAGIPDIVHDSKIRFQATYRAKVRSGAWRPYAERLWQRGYHDRIIRSDRELEAIRRYIETNPTRWWERRHPS